MITRASIIAIIDEMKTCTNINLEIDPLLTLPIFIDSKCINNSVNQGRCY